MKDKEEKEKERVGKSSKEYSRQRKGICKVS
jgi:hypothetical protein